MFDPLTGAFSRAYILERLREELKIAKGGKRKCSLLVMDIDKFIGIWKNKAGNVLEIKPNDKKSLKVTFLSGKTGKPVVREYYAGDISVAELFFPRR